MHFLYIIYSPSINKYYIGETANINERIKQHNSGFFKGAFTKQTKDWTIKFTFSLTSRTEARKAEKFIKRMKSRKFIEKIINQPDIIMDLINKYYIGHSINYSLRLKLRNNLRF